VCKASGATLAPPSFQPPQAFSLPILSTGYMYFFTDPRKFDPRVLKLVCYCFSSRQSRRAHLTKRGSNLTHGKGGELTRASPVYALRAYTLLTTMLALFLPRHALSCVG
jgi:hypothetical protein